jgi:hypothetical protein
VGAGIEERPQPSGGKRNRIRLGDADDVKALCAGESGEFSLECRRA